MINLTVAGWLGFIIVAILIIFVCAYVGYSVKDTPGLCAGLGIGLILSIFVLCGFNWYFNSTASGIRALKTQESNFNNGINRRVTVYDVNGNVIQEYEGKFDVEYDDDRILFDDENGLRHIIYYPTGTVIIDEVE